MKEMIKAMVEQMVAESIKEVMAEMMGTKPVIAKAEAHPISNTMSVEDLLSLEEEEDAKLIAKHNASLQPLEFIVEDFMPKGGRKYRKGLKYNKFINNKAVWTYNHIKIRENYPAIKFNNGYYYADSLADLKVFASSFHITETLTDDQMTEVKAYWESKKK